MKRCDNCFETNSDGATNCVICGDPLDVPQVINERRSSVDPPRFEAVAMADVVEIDDEVVLEEYEDEDTTRLNLVPADDPVPDDPVTEDPVSEEPLSVEPLPEDPISVDRISAEEAQRMHDRATADLLDLPEPGGEPEPIAEPISSSPTLLPVAPQTGGTVVLQVFHDREPRVVHVHPVVNDITLVGREDPQRDVFPDLDLGRLPPDQVSSGRASRQHFRLLRDGDRFFLYVYKGSTGTQVCDRMVDPSAYGKRFEIQVGDRIILGGKLRMKLARVDG